MNMHFGFAPTFPELSFSLAYDFDQIWIILEV